MPVIFVMTARLAMQEDLRWCITMLPCEPGLPKKVVRMHARRTPLGRRRRPRTAPRRWRQGRRLSQSARCALARDAGALQDSRRMFEEEQDQEQARSSQVLGLLGGVGLAAC